MYLPGSTGEVAGQAQGEGGGCSGRCRSRSKSMLELALAASIDTLASGHQTDDDENVAGCC